MPRILLTIAGPDEAPATLPFDYPEGSSLTLLDALESLRGTRAPGLRYRHSCHHGSCGTCGARADGREILLCVTPLASLGPGPVLLEPLRKAAAIGGLAVDPGPLFSALPPEAGYLGPSEVAHRAALPGEEEPRRLDDCIECGLCDSACPLPRERPFAGPAALALARRALAEGRGREDVLLGFAARPEGVAACERRFACSRACPQGVAPGRGIEELRRMLAKGD